jgi:hypothetical protein
MATRFAVATGNFSNGAIWDNGVVPTSDDDVFANGFTVTINGTYTVQSIRNTTPSVFLPNVATPTMTSNTSPSGIASANTAQANHDAFKAFNQNITSGDDWRPVGQNTGILIYQFPIGKIIKRYSILNTFSTGTCARNWTFEGSNDGISWTVLDTVLLASVAVNSAYVSGLLSNTTSYTYYRINVTAVQTTGNILAITEFNMTESTNTVYGNIAGGKFIYANGGNLTCTATQAIFVGAASTPVLEMTLASPNTATFNGSVLTLTSLGNYIAIRHSSSGTLNLNGNYSIDSSFTGRSIISVTSTGTLNIVGDLASTANANNANTLLMSTVGTINITGNVTGAPSVSGTPLSTSTIFISSAGNLNITGNTTANLTPAVYLTGATNYTQIGSVNASTTQAAIYNLTAASTISVTGIITAGSGAPAIYSAFALSSGYGSGTFVRVSGNVVNTSNIMAIVAPRVTIDTNTSSWLFQISTGGNRTLYAAGVALGNPATSNVRNGVTYGPALELTGTAFIPTADNVRKGVPVDATIGTADLTAADMWNYLASNITTSGSIGEVVKNIKTKTDLIPNNPTSNESVGAIVASYNI